MNHQTVEPSLGLCGDQEGLIQIFLQRQQTTYLQCPIKTKNLSMVLLDGQGENDLSFLKEQGSKIFTANLAVQSADEVRYIYENTFPYLVIVFEQIQKLGSKAWRHISVESSLALEKKSAAASKLCHALQGIRHLGYEQMLELDHFRKVESLQKEGFCIQASSSSGSGNTTFSFFFRPSPRPYETYRFYNERESIEVEPLKNRWSYCQLLKDDYLNFLPYHLEKRKLNPEQILQSLVQSKAKLCNLLESDWELIESVR